jgi:arylsulfatase A-like enzyme
MNIVLLVIDSLRACSLGRDAGFPRTPFLDRLQDDAVKFRRAHATECWTLPTHLSMFTGLLPSEHGAHFQSMEYARQAPTIAEILAQAGYHTEVITRNSLFDGTVPGATRGFERNTRILARLGGVATPLTLFLAIAKPRVQRLIRKSGFINSLQRNHRDFLYTVARMGIPADQTALEHATLQMADLRRRAKPFFLFLNLFDVHMPYSPGARSPLRPLTSLDGCLENLSLPFVLPKVSSHAYLRSGFRLSPRNQRMLLGRYHRAIELMDEKLARFYAEAASLGLLDDTMLIVTADHGEAFGDHGLYFHDASVWQTHLHVPLWVRHPDCAPAVVDDVVSTKDLFGLMRAVGLGTGLSGTILDRATRERQPVALAEHFHYPETADLLPQYTQNLAAAVVGARKLVVRREGPVEFDLERDPREAEPRESTVADFAVGCRRDGAPPAAIDAAIAHLRRWETTSAAA